MPVEVKICGVDRPAAVEAAIDAGARWIGFVFYPRSPRSVGPELAQQLARIVPTGVRTVGLFVEPDDAWLARVVAMVPLDLIQLHGEETPGRVREIRTAWSIPVMTAIRVGEAADLDAVPAQAAVADRLLFDARPPKRVTALPGGNGLPFDWTLLTGRSWPKPWMLSGGLTADNLAEAVSVTGATAVDVSSGVEDRPGHKDVARIRAFMAAAAST
jgi:phosphoribosylanthranilate isomerase